MSSKKRRKELETRLRLWLLGAVSVLTLLIGAGNYLSENLLYSTELSANSLKNLESLNRKFDLVVSDKGIAVGSENLLAELSAANVLDGGRADYKGLIATMDESMTKGGVVVLKAAHEVSDSTLRNIAAVYQETIPEFENVEVDQEVQLEGYPVYSIDYEHKTEPVVRLSSEDDAVRVAVIDSGIDPDHEIFENTVVEKGWNTIDGDSNMYDDVGHGTHMTGIIVTNAPNATIIPYKIAGADGGDLSNVLEAFQMAMDAKADIINASFGVMERSYSLERMVQKAKQKGIIVVAAAGNNNSDGPFYPAEYSESLAVAGVDGMGAKMPKSNFGYWVDLASHGDRIKSSLPGNEYGYKSGTSPATAYVTAKIVNIIEEKGWMSARSIVRYLSSEAEEKVGDGELAGVPIVE